MKNRNNITKEPELQENIYRKHSQDFIYLIACALKGVSPDKTRLETMDFQRVFWLSCNHMMCAMASNALMKAHALETLPDSLSQEWQAARYAAVQKSVNLRSEARNVLAQLSAAKIWHVPLKGLVIAEYYPSTGYREMADCDILVNAEKAEEAKNVMESLGYRTEHFQEGHHDIYHKSPVYNFELHKQLYELGISAAYDRYLTSTQSRLRNRPESKYDCYFSKEDTYVFIILHAYKHYRSGGTGLRALTDVYVYNHAFPDIDHRYLKREFEKLEIQVFEQHLRELSEIIFSKPDNIYRVEFTEEQQSLLHYIIGSGAFGTSDNAVKNALKRYSGGKKITIKARLHYIFERLYPTDPRCVERYAYFYNHKWAFPFLPIYRLSLRGDIRSILAEIKRALRMK